MTTKVAFERVGAFSGVLASLLLIVGGGLTDINPIVDVTASSANIANVFIENQTELLTGTYLRLLGVFALMWFLAYLREVLLENASDKSWVISVAFGGGLIACAMLLLSAHFMQSFTILDNYGSETQVAKALYLLDWNWYLLVEAPALAALVGATTAISFSNKIFPRWMNWWGVLLTIILLSPGIPGSGVVVTYLWLAVLSVLLLLKTRGST